MHSNVSENDESSVTLRPVGANNWRDIAKLKVAETQQDFVADPSHYLALCCFGKLWQPLAICLGEQVIGFMMWAVDPADGSCWLGGILIDQGWQRRGYGRQAVQAAIIMLKEKYAYLNFALSYDPTNLAAKHLYNKLGFVEMDEWEDDEIVARLSLAK
ncbi:GNAT family N-acetyltransferase [Candidatus Leptofilum sp.]|uniref:GNAT family N-acetyltransferase n=1 Tax=Candidatus Leptofilum sp. TaxID=3241576 RepID=UPI003B5CECD4